MAITEYGVGNVDVSGTGTGAEILIASLSDPGVYVLRIDLAEMISGDTLRVFSEVDADGGTPAMEAIELEVSGAPADAAFACVDVGPVVIATNQFGAFSLNQTAGTARAFDWLLTRIS